MMFNILSYSNMLYRLVNMQFQVSCLNMKFDSVKFHESWRSSNWIYAALSCLNKFYVVTEFRIVDKNFIIFLNDYKFTQNRLLESGSNVLWFLKKQEKSKKLIKLFDNLSTLLLGRVRHEIFVRQHVTHVL